jgi:L-iditol 2-dehydrogenase
VERLGRHDLVFEAVGRPEAWRAVVEGARPGGTVVLVGGCRGGSDATLPTGPLHYDELDVRGAFHHSRAEVDRALELLASGAVDWRGVAGETVGLGDLADALRRPAAGEARKLVVDPAR